MAKPLFGIRSATGISSRVIVINSPRSTSPISSGSSTLTCIRSQDCHLR